MDPPRPTIVIAEPFRPNVVERLRKHANVVELDTSSPEKLIDAVKDADALLIRMKAHVTARIIDAAPRLRVIGRAGVSLDHIDMRAAQRRQITVVHTPVATVVSIADYTVALMLAISRRLAWYDRHIRAGEFESLRTPYGREIRESTIGLLGGGAVAEEVARIFRQGFKARVIASSPDDYEPVPTSADAVDFDALIAESDILSVHLAVGERSEPPLGAAQFERMKPTACVVNTSRGTMVDNSSLAEALKTHRIAGAALDVFDSEPLPPDHPLRNAPNCLLTPHVASATLGVSDSYFQVADDVIRVLQGQAPRFPAAMD